MYYTNLRNLNKGETVITFGTFDLYHLGHKRILERASVFGKLYVGVSSDQFNFEKKKCMPFYPEASRMEIIKSVKYVHDAFLEESLELKSEYINRCGATILVMGDDWKGKFDHLVGLCPTLKQVVYLERTEGVSTTQIEDSIRASPPRL